jgi:hypothetical protein
MRNNNKRFITKTLPFLIISIVTIVFIILKTTSHSLENTGYIGMSLPASFRAFSITSPWNTPIPTNPAIDPNSKTMITNLKNKAVELKGNITNWTIPLFVIDSSISPKRNVPTTSKAINLTVDPDRNAIAEGIPIPEGVWSDPKSDGHMLLVDPNVKKTWDFSAAKRLPDGSWTASMIDIWDLNGAGYRQPFSGDYWWTYGARGSGFPLIAGLIRPEEIEAGEIKHALVCATPVNRKIRTLSSGKYELCSPTASRTDGFGIGNEFIPEGARLQLDPKLNLDTLNLSPATKIIARAMQKYGMYNGDNAETFTIYFQNLGADGGKWKNYNFFSDLKKIPIGKFRVLKCTLIVKK